MGFTIASWKISLFSFFHLDNSLFNVSYHTLLFSYVNHSIIIPYSLLSFLISFPFLWFCFNSWLIFLSTSVTLYYVILRMGYNFGYMDTKWDTIMWDTIFLSFQIHLLLSLFSSGNKVSLPKLYVILKSLLLDIVQAVQISHNIHFHLPCMQIFLFPIFVILFLNYIHHFSY